MHALGIPADPALVVVLALVLGLIIGSFLNVVIYRLPKMLEADFRAECDSLDQPPDYVPVAGPRFNLATPRSACPTCNTPIAGYDNVPLLSWLLLKGRCRHCKTAISARYPLVELGTGLLSALVAAHFGPSIATGAALLFLWVLIALFWIDADTYFLPDSLTLGLLWLGLLCNLTGMFAPLADAVIGAMAGYLALWSVYWAFKLVTGREGMGYGDFKLLAALGAWLGWKMLPAIILLSSLAGAVIGIALVLLAKRGWGKPLPFGPYLAIAGLLAMLEGPVITKALWGM